MIPKFINRENELDFLENCYKSPQPEFIIIYGRRRVGKTELIQRSLQNKHGAYFLASKDTTYENINEFRKTIAEQLDIPIFSRIESNVTTAHPTAAELRGITICDKKLHNELLYATPSVWGNPTMICAGGNAGV